MKLTLDETQRLNLHALLGAQRTNLDDIRLLWKIQDRIDVSDEEKRAIDFRIENINGMQQPNWNPSKGTPREYEFNSDEYARLTRMLKEWQPGFLPTNDRRWLEPLMAQLDLATPNGHK